MDRSSVRPHAIGSWRLAYPLLLLSGLVAAAGCTSVFATAAYLIKGNNIPAEYEGLRAKKIVVVCRPPLSGALNNANVAEELAEKVENYLSVNVPKAKVIPQEEVAKWMDQHQWENFAEVGKALKADMVVGIELDNFSLHQSQTLYQGHASGTKIQVFDLTKEGKKAVYESTLAQASYPPSAGIPTSERTEPQFRDEYINYLGELIATKFYPHDKYQTIARDADALR